MALPIRPPDRPVCKHGKSLRKGCSECYHENQEKRCKRTPTKDQQVAELKAENTRLNEMINEMLSCVNNGCNCGSGGVCCQCKEMVARHRGELD